MMRSMYSGVSGLKTHQTKMDVIGNNIANVNTVAYKTQSITFSELMYQTTQKASGPNELTGTGGVNARQIGLGVQSAAINTAISTQGATQTTGNPFDICITGEAFFIVSDGSSNYFTRAGAFSVDSVGNLVMTSNGYNVMGWGVDNETLTIKQDKVEALRIMSAENMTYPPEATTKSYVSGILDKNDKDVNKESGKAVNFSFYDNLGYAYTAKCSIHQTTTDGEYYVQLDDVLDSTGKTIKEKYGVDDLSDIVVINDGGHFAADVSVDHNLDATASCSSKTITYKDSTGATKTKKISELPGTKVHDPEDSTDDADLASVEISDADLNADVKQFLKDVYGFSDEDIANLHKISIDASSGTLTVLNREVTGAKLVYNTDNGFFTSIDGRKTFTFAFKDDIVPVTDPTGGAGTGGTTPAADVSLKNFEDITIDWTATNMYNNSGTSTIGTTTGDEDGIGAGRKLGNMTGITIQTNGMIYASYDNGMTRLMGQIAVAEFSNAAGLEKAGDNLYAASLNSGDFDGIGVDVTGSGGYMTTGVLEMSNVDLSTEFTEMITTQRGFQANSRIITVSDTMLEELVNLKR